MYEVQFLVIEVRWSKRDKMIGIYGGSENVDSELTSMDR